LTLNQLVEGSSPSRPTNEIKDLWHIAKKSFLFFAPVGSNGTHPCRSGGATWTAPHL